MSREGFYSTYHKIISFFQSSVEEPSASSSKNLAGTLAEEPIAGHSGDAATIQNRSMFSISTGGQLYSDVGLYKSTVVSIKHIKKEHIQITRNVLLEFNEASSLSSLALLSLEYSISSFVSLLNTINQIHCFINILICNNSSYKHVYYDVYYMMNKVIEHKAILYIDY